MVPRDAAILRHVGLYRLSVRPVLSRVFLSGRDPGNVVKELIKKGLLQSRPGLGGRNSYYQLTERGAAASGFPGSRAEAPGPQAIQEHLGILWFCTMLGRSRTRLESDALAELFPGGPPRGEHCLEKLAGGYRVTELYVPTADTSLENVARRVREQLESALANPEVSKWVGTRQYAFAILVDTEDRAPAVRRRLGETMLGRLPITAQASFQVEVVLGVRTVRETLRRVRSESLGTDTAKEREVP